MALFKWRARLARSSTQSSTDTAASRRSAIRRFFSSVCDLLSPRRLAQKLFPSPEPAEPTLDDIARALAAQHGIPFTEAYVLALLDAQQRCQARIAAEVQRLYEAGVLLDGDSYVTRESSVVSSAAPGTPPNEFDGDVDVDVEEEEEVGWWEEGVSGETVVADVE
ncbi:hypothetical protein PsYK624_146020 [Phanerochaete sordida]|uniref:Uncharacterized protein n=1 Tax=Phanerochaete sordida TaxID=48140 RepID=A0A9P3GM77_9APHY|nr:hypothetical protein PsYK624_146020 [Phanerochaete sordida]